ncbi:MAPEG family protein [Phanerochaete sordida]|uniref:MAPEG family protein n=1 Tax=Phanerochaete sordida TaxID=48140 RepID=A0A9P3G081_9APHY|nr:MAPEG family protein [Phanerochaete sordida]
MPFSLDTPGLALYSIPAVWFTAFYPSFIRFIQMSNTIGYNNVLPRANMARLKDNQKLDQATRDRLARMIGAHENGMENLPLWIGAVLAGYIAGLPHSTLNTFALGYVGLRVLYNFIYINHTSEAVSNLRSLTFFTGLAFPLTLLVKSANKLAASV